METEHRCAGCGEYTAPNKFELCDACVASRPDEDEPTDVDFDDEDESNAEEQGLGFHFAANTTSNPAVDRSFWTVVPKFGAAGGPMVHALTDAGALKAFSVGSRLDTRASEALLALHARGGQGTTTKRVGAKIKLTDLGEYDQTIWGRLRSKGYVERVEGINDSLRITTAGREALRRGFEEQQLLIERVRKAHPVTSENTANRERLKRRLMR